MSSVSFSWPPYPQRIMCVYAIVHDATQRHYIGATNDLKIRWRAHRSLLNKGTHTNAALQADWTKCGADAFTLMVLEVVPEENALYATERRWHDAIPLRYNVNMPLPTWYVRPEKRPAMGIYAWVHVPTGARYVGSSANLGKRRAQHVNELNRGTHHSRAFQALWDRDGKGAFRFDVVEAVSDESILLQREQEWLDCSANCLNSSPTAGSIKGLKRSPENVAKMRQVMRDHLRTERGKAHWAALQEGREGIGPKLSAALKEWWADPANRERGIEINRRRFTKDQASQESDPGSVPSLRAG